MACGPFQLGFWRLALRWGGVGAQVFGRSVRTPMRQYASRHCQRAQSRAEQNYRHVPIRNDFGHLSSNA